MIAATFLGLAACEERNPEHFADVTGVYFNNTTGLMSVTDSLDLTFVYEASDVMEVPVKVQLLGRAVDYDRPLDISVTLQRRAWVWISRRTSPLATRCQPRRRRW